MKTLSGKKLQAALRRVDPLVLKELKKTFKEWEVRSGSKHDKLVVDGKIVSLISRGKITERNSRSGQNSRARLRKSG